MTRRCSAFVSVFVLVAGAFVTRLPAQGNPVTGGANVKSLQAQVQAARSKQADPRDVMMLDLMETMLGQVEMLEQLVADVDRKVEAISETQGTRVIPDILGNMALDEAKQPDPGGKGKLAAAAEQAVAELFKDHFMRSVQGHLVIDNHTDAYFFVKVNGVAYFVPPERHADPKSDKAVSILVPFGKVRTQLFHAKRDDSDPNRPMWRQDREFDPEPRTWGDEASGKWKVVEGKDGKKRLMLPLTIQR